MHVWNPQVHAAVVKQVWLMQRAAAGMRACEPCLDCVGDVGVMALHKVVGGPLEAVECVLRLGRG